MSETKRSTNVAMIVVTAIALILIIIAVVPSSHWHTYVGQKNVMNSSYSSRNAASLRASQAVDMQEYYAANPQEAPYVEQAEQKALQRSNPNW